LRLKISAFANAQEGKFNMSVKGITANEGLNNRVTSTVQKSGADFSDILASVMSVGKTDLDKIFEAAAERYNVPVNLLKAVAKAESNFNPNALSKCGAQGIMQLMPATAESLGVADPFDPEQNIMGGAKYLSQMLQRFDGDTKLALAAYNAGPGSVIKYKGIPPYAETQNYVKKVMGYCGENISAGMTVESSKTAAAADIWRLMRGENISDSGSDSQLGDEIAASILISMYRLQSRLFSDTASLDADTTTGF
jgi:hypothetical protein